MIVFTILKLKFGQDIFLYILVKTLRLRFGQAFEAEVWLGF